MARIAMLATGDRFSFTFCNWLYSTNCPLTFEPSKVSKNSRLWWLPGTVCPHGYTMRMLTPWALIAISPVLWCKPCNPSTHQGRRLFFLINITGIVTLNNSLTSEIVLPRFWAKSALPMTDWKLVVQYGIHTRAVNPIPFKRLWKYSRTMVIHPNFLKLCSSFRSSPLCQVPPGRDREGTGVSQKDW